MCKVRCNLCRKQMPTLKILNTHLLKTHPKTQIIKQMLKNSILRPSKVKKNRKPVYLNENVHISYVNDTIIIEDESSTNYKYEFSFDDSKNYTIMPVVNDGEKTAIKAVENEPEEKDKKKKRGNQFKIGIKKVLKSLDDQTGQFYKCQCMERNFKGSSDTDSASDVGKHFYCKSCGSGYATNEELGAHEMQHQYHCKICNRNYSYADYREHFIEQHLTKLYICHLCGLEFICKDILQSHLNYHLDQQTLEHVLGLERDYTMYDFGNINLIGEDYNTNINNILMYLTYPYDIHQTRNMLMKVVCEICYQDFYAYEYERHLKLTHFCNNFV